MPKFATDVCNPKEPSNVSSMVLNGTTKHSIDLIDCLGESSDMAAAASAAAAAAAAAATAAAAAADKNSTSFDANSCENKQVFREPLIPIGRGAKNNLQFPKLMVFKEKMIS